MRNPDLQIRDFHSELKLCIAFLHSTIQVMNNSWDDACHLFNAVNVDGICTAHRIGLAASCLAIGQNCCVIT